MFRIFLLITCFFCAANGFAQQDPFTLAAPKDTLSLKKLKLWSTQYYIHAFQSSGNIPVLLENGTPSGLYADTCDFCEAALEGTAFVTDSSGKICVINFVKSGDTALVNCRCCAKYARSKLRAEEWGKALWVKTEGYGLGVQNYKLVPYRTIAVDKNTIPYGSVIYIPAAKGATITLPDGTSVVHDGYFFAADTGGAIKGNHIDTFTGISEKNPFKHVLSNEKKTFSAYLITEPEIRTFLKQEHGK